MLEIYIYKIIFSKYYPVSLKNYALVIDIRLYLRITVNNNNSQCVFFYFRCVLLMVIIKITYHYEVKRDNK